MPHALLLALLASAAAPAPAPEAAPAPPPADNRTYFDRPLTEADVAGKSLRELAILRNTIYARAHNFFRKRWLHEYFSQFPWYRETGVEDGLLSELDHQNAEFLDRYETGLPREELLRRKAALWARHAEPMRRAESTGLSFLAVTPDGKLLVAAAGAGPALVLDAASGALLRQLPVPEGPTQEVAYALSGDGASLRRAWRSAWDGPLRLLDLPLSGAAPGPVVELAAGQKQTYALLAGDRALLQSAQGLELWDLLPQPRQRWQHPGLGAREGLVTDRRGRFALVGQLAHQPAHALVWDLEADELAQDTPVDSYAWPHSPTALAEDGRRLLLPQGYALELYDLPASGPTSTVGVAPRGPQEPARVEAALAPGGQALFTWEGGDSLARRELPGLGLRWQVAVRPRPEWARWAVSPDGARLYVASGNRIDAWDAHLGQPDPAWRGPGLWTEEEAVEGMLLARALGEPVPALLAQGEERNPLDDLQLLDALLTVEQLRDLSRRDLMLLRNTIYARRGKSWKGTLQGYFSRTAWYRAQPGYTDARLTALDKKNLKVVTSLEQSLGGPLPDRDEAPRRFRG